MNLSMTSEYALRSMIFLAQQDQKSYLSADFIAEHTDIPRRYLSKILTDLVRSNLLNATRGKKGGFQLARATSEISLYDVLDLFEQFDRTHCWFGNQACGDKNPCSAHKQWKKLIEYQETFLKTTHLSDVISTE